MTATDSIEGYTRNPPVVTGGVFWSSVPNLLAALDAGVVLPRTRCSLDMARHAATFRYRDAASVCVLAATRAGCTPATIGRDPSDLSRRAIRRPAEPLNPCSGCGPVAGACICVGMPHGCVRCCSNFSSCANQLAQHVASTASDSLCTTCAPVALADPDHTVVGLPSLANHDRWQIASWNVTEGEEISAVMSSARLRPTRLQWISSARTTVRAPTFRRFCTVLTRHAATHVTALDVRFCREIFVGEGEEVDRNGMCPLFLLGTAIGHW